VSEARLEVGDRERVGATIPGDEAICETLGNEDLHRGGDVFYPHTGHRLGPKNGWTAGGEPGIQAGGRTRQRPNSVQNDAFAGGEDGPPTVPGDVDDLLEIGHREVDRSSHR
jgi:hypothetical protein